MKLSELNILSIGNTVQMVGAIYAGEGRVLLCFFPEDHVFLDGKVTHTVEGLETHTLNMGAEDWQKFIQQTDVMETEILTKASDGTLAKAIFRKSQRQIDSVVSWKVFKRDGYACRYCGKDDVPLTVDHLVRWEEGGPTTTDNLVAACKKCNRVRGDTPYEEWMRHPFYTKSSKSLRPEVRSDNEELIGKIRFIPRKVHTRSR